MNDDALEGNGLGRTVGATERADAGLDTPRDHAVNAVSGSEYPVGIDQGAATEVLSVAAR